MHGRLGLAVQKTILRRLQFAGLASCLNVSHGKHFRQARLGEFVYANVFAVLELCMALGKDKYLSQP